MKPRGKKYNQTYTLPKLKILSLLENMIISFMIVKKAINLTHDSYIQYTNGFLCYESLPCKMSSLRKFSSRLEKQQILQFSNTNLKVLHALNLKNKILSEELKSVL